MSSQNGAAGAALSSGADVAALGGFSGRESEVSVDWLADRVEDGTIRWVLTDGEGAGMANDGRTGSQSVMSAIEATCTPVSGVDGLYDCSGAAGARGAVLDGVRGARCASAAAALRGRRELAACSRGSGGTVAPSAPSRTWRAPLRHARAAYGRSPQ